jgi:drug/metabolite transporter (DMT)-like permease
MRTLRQVPFLAGLALDGVGFLAQYVALRTVPIFVVQAALAGSLAVTAVVAVPVLGARLGRRQWSAVGAVCLGLALLGLSAGAESTNPVPLGFRLALLACVAVLAAAGVAAARCLPPYRRWVSAWSPGSRSAWWRWPPGRPRARPSAAIRRPTR